MYIYECNFYKCTYSINKIPCIMHMLSAYKISMYRYIHF